MLITFVDVILNFRLYNNAILSIYLNYNQINNKFEVFFIHNVVISIRFVTNSTKHQFITI